MSSDYEDMWQCKHKNFSSLLQVFFFFLIVKAMVTMGMRDHLMGLLSMLDNLWALLSCHFHVTYTFIFAMAEEEMAVRFCIRI